MSRIEKALEKAAELRGEGKKMPSPAVKNADYRTSDAQEKRAEPPPQRPQGRSPLPDVPVEPLKIDHPLIVTYREPKSPIAEEFRKLKSMIVKMGPQGNVPKTLMVTSALSGEGKSVTAVNLAITLAQEYDHSVLLFDADLRKPSIHKYLNLETRFGLSDCLLDGIDLSEALVRTGIGKLSFLSAGRSVENPTELLGSRKMRALVQEVRHRYPERFIIFDTPPVLPVAESRLLSTYMDGVIFVVREQVGSVMNVQDAIDALRRESILGIVYNHVRNESLSGRYHYFYDGY